MVEKKTTTRKKKERRAADVPEAVFVLVEAVQSKKASDVVILDLRGLTDVADFFLLCTADVDTHARAIMDAARDALRSLNRRPWHVEGEDAPNWILIDYVDIVVHTLREDARRFYGLEEMWADAPRVPTPDLSAPKKGKTAAATEES
jgi:ribosome-associated protein